MGFKDKMMSYFNFKATRGKNKNDIKMNFNPPKTAEEIKKELILKLAQAKSKSSSWDRNSTDDLYEKWLNQNTLNNDIYNRDNRIKLLEMAQLNDPIINKFLTLVSSEVLYDDNNYNGCPVSVYNITDETFEEYIEGLFKRLKIDNSFLSSIVKQLVLYGDCFVGLNIDEREGIKGVKILPQTAIKQKLEFNPIQVLVDEDNKLGKDRNILLNNFGVQTSKLKVIEDLYNEEDKEKNGMTDFNSYELGYELANNGCCYAWEILHFKLENDSNLFYPYGESLCLQSIALNNQIQNLICLQSLARQYSFPIKVYSVKGAETDTPENNLLRLELARQEFKNNFTSYNTEEQSINDEVWTLDNYLIFDYKSPSIDFKFIDDIKLLINREVSSFPVPKGSFNLWTDESDGKAESGVALIEQYKPFSRLCNSIQKVILDKLADLIRLHLYITSSYPYDIDFSLKLYSNCGSNVNDSGLSLKKNKIEFCMDLLDNLIKFIGGEEGEYSKLPKKIIQKVFKNYSGMSTDEINEYLDTLQIHSTILNKASKKEEKDGEEVIKECEKLNRHKATTNKQHIIKEGDYILGKNHIVNYIYNKKSSPLNTLIKLNRGLNNE